MQYIAALDYKHLDNGVFLTSLARSLSQQKSDEEIRRIIVHTESKYTERIIQTGVMRDEATIRSIKDLNKRLVALFADQGVSTIGINPYQRNFITLEDDQLQFDHSFLDSLPSQPVLLLSNLVQDLEKNQVTAISLPRLLTFLYTELEVDQLFLFAKSDESEVFTDTIQNDNLYWDTMDANFREKQIPDEFSDFSLPVRLTSARDFNQIPSPEHSILIKAPKQTTL